MHSSFKARNTKPILGSIPSRPRPPRDHHHRQLTHVLHLPPSARRPHQQLVLRRPRQRTPRPHPRPRRSGRLASPRCQPGARRGIMTLVDPSSQAAKEAAAFGNSGIILTQSEDCINSPFNSSLVLD